MDFSAFSGCSKKGCTFSLLGAIPSLEMVIPKNLISPDPNSHLDIVNFKLPRLMEVKKLLKLKTSSSHVCTAVSRSTLSYRLWYHQQHRSAAMQRSMYLRMKEPKAFIDRFSPCLSRKTAKVRETKLKDSNWTDTGSAILEAWYA